MHTLNTGIRSLQCILLKVCLLLGVKIYTGIEFLEILEPNDQIGWHASVDPEDHPVSQFEFDFIVGMSQLIQSVSIYMYVLNGVMLQHTRICTIRSLSYSHDLLFFLL